MKKEMEYYSVNDFSKTLKGMARYLLSKIWWFVVAILLGVALGIGYYLLQKPKYEAVSTFILEEKQGGLGGLSSIASQFGFDLGGMSGGGSLFAGDNILEILTSKRIVQAVLLTPAAVSGPDTSIALADQYLIFSGMGKKLAKKNVGPLSYAKPLESLSRVEDSVLNIIYDQVVKKSLKVERSTKKGTIIQVSVLSKNSEFSRLMTERVVDDAAKLYLSVKTSTTMANINKLQRRSDSLLALLNNKSFTVAASSPLDVNPGLKTSLVPAEIANRDKTIIATLYGEVTKNLEASKLILAQQSPIIQLLDVPGKTLFDHKLGALKSMAFGALGLMAVCLAVQVLRYYYIQSAE